MQSAKNKTPQNVSQHDAVMPRKTSSTASLTTEPSSNDDPTLSKEPQTRLYPSQGITSRKQQQRNKAGTPVRPPLSGPLPGRSRRLTRNDSFWRNCFPWLFFLAGVGCMIYLEYSFQQILQLSSAEHAILPQTQRGTTATTAVASKSDSASRNNLDSSVITDIRDASKSSSNSSIFGGVESRVFEKWPSTRPLPCFDPDEVEGYNWTTKLVQKRPTPDGLFYIKLVKTGSSTTSGVHLRLARNLARRLAKQESINKDKTDNNSNNTTSYDICRSRFLHAWAGPKMLNLATRNRNQSFLWTIVREPTKRYISDFFHFQVSRRNITPTESTMRGYFSTYKHKHHSIDWLSTTGYKYRITDPIQTANQIMKDYDFIGVVERLDESLVVLAMLLNIPLGDILYLGSKRSGGYDDGAHKNTCYLIQPSNLTSEMNTYLSSKSWQKYIEPEERLFQAAYHSLDLTMEHLGRELVQKNLAMYKHAQAVVEAKCLDSTRFPCSPTGEKRNETDVDCLTRDLGCGFDCLDAVARELGIDQHLPEQ